MERIKRPRGFEKNLNREERGRIAWLAFYRVTETEAWHVWACEKGNETYWLGKIFVTHGQADGSVRDLQSAKLAEMVVCCYPGAVKSRHPELRIFGDWECTTWVNIQATDRAGRAICPYIAIGKSL